MFQQTQKKIQLNKAFEGAVAAGDTAAVNELFSEDKVAEEQPFIDFIMVTTTAIMHAAQKQDWAMVEALYELGANLDVMVDPHKWYLINECIVNAPDNVSKAIINYSNVNVQTRHGETPLMVAIKRHKGAMAEYLIETGRVDLNLTNNEGENAAHYAARENNQELFLILLAKGMPLLRKNKKGQTPVDLIEDDVFRLSLPVELEKIENDGGNLLINDKAVEDKQEAVEDKPKKVSGLSSIKKKSV
jgi:ankyrin repeat protein